MDGNRDRETTSAAQPHSVNRWLVVGTVGVWLLVLLVAGLQVMRSGRADARITLLCLAGLLQAGGMATQREKLKPVLMVCGGIVAATTLVLLLLQRI
jgi:hypothetical protein